MTNIIERIKGVTESLFGIFVTAIVAGLLLLNILLFIVDTTTDLTELTYVGKLHLVIVYGVFIFAALLLSSTIFLNLWLKILRERIISDDAIDQIQNGAKSIEKFQTTIGTSLEKIDSNLAQSESIANYLDDYKSTKTFRLDSKTLLYDRLLEARVKSQKKGGGIIYVTNFLIKLETTSLDYYRKEIEYCQNYPDVIVKKIITVHDQTKFDIYKRIVEEASSKGITNLHLAYLHIQKFDLTQQPGIMGVQVLNEKKVILMDPRVARLTDLQPQWMPLVINGEYIPEVCTAYHEFLWDQIRHSQVNEHGCILYDGGQNISPGFQQATDEEWKQIERQMNDVSAVIPSRADSPEIWAAIDKYRQDQLPPQTDH